MVILPSEFLTLICRLSKNMFKRVTLHCEVEHLATRFVPNLFKRYQVLNVGGVYTYIYTIYRNLCFATIVPYKTSSKRTAAWNFGKGKIASSSDPPCFPTKRSRLASPPKRWRFGSDDVGGSKSRGTPKSSIFIVFSILNHPFWGRPIFLKPPCADDVLFTRVHFQVTFSREQSTNHVFSPKSELFQVCNSGSQWCQKFV